MPRALLSQINSPVDLKNLNVSDLKPLAEEMRKRIIDVMSVNGGHLASSLGSVELLIAMHRVFNAPQDKFIFDVGHQSYPHKLLTGRNESFDLVRKYRGLCGFTHPKESEYDHFHAGHAGTALSLGLGVATSRDLRGGDDYVLPVIGDATLTCGLALEAMNNIHRGLKKFIVVLNDNAMSISKNVGAITNILSRLLNSPMTNRFTQDLEQLVSKIPTYGNVLAKQGHKLAESIKNLVSPAPFFDEFGLAYIGPVDGHDIKQLINVFEALKDFDRPVLLHVLTKKGQGMPEAMQNPITYHGARPFSVETGKFLPSKSTKLTFPKIFGREILALADEDPDVVAVTPAMSCGSCLDALMQKHPNRCIDVGIAEGHCVTFSGGLAYQNKKKVVCSIYATFLQRALDNLFHDVCLQEIPVVFAIDRAGISGPDGSTHHGIYDISFMNAMPNMVISQPRNGQLLAELFRSSFTYNRPTAIRYPNMETDDVTSDIKYRPVGKGEILALGQEYLIIALGHMFQTALNVRAFLEQKGISATVVDPIFVKPLDEELFKELLKTHHYVITIEEHSVTSGLGSVVNNFIVKNGYQDIQVLNCGIPEMFINHGSYAELTEEIGLTPAKITTKILEKFPPKVLNSSSIG
ncbi:MAG: 1-deoxy-D-xylulose-5-phosphate synthase [Parachlamydiales bacterium]|nr:1-deoxy-D-xylulose-5-phosphate synthase [Parachlamydiales bacterium]